MKIGILGAAKVAPYAVIKPALRNPEVSVVAIAARDADRARTFARKHGIPRVHAAYQDLLDDPEVDAVYIPLPSALHGRWTMAALEAGKHVLCEKPFAANAEEAEVVADRARASGLVVMEAFHYRYHAVMERLLEIVGSGAIGELRHVEARFCVPLFARRDIRWSFALGGGATMDVGCYPIHFVRTVVGAEPEVRGAVAATRHGNVDRRLAADLQFPSGVTGAISSSMLSRTLAASDARIVGTGGTIRVRNPFQPAFYHRIEVVSDGRRQVQKLPRNPGTYDAQLSAFVAAIGRPGPFPTDVDDALANMRVIDACYRAAGLAPREPARS